MPLSQNTSSEGHHYGEYLVRSLPAASPVRPQPIAFDPRAGKEPGGWPQGETRQPTCTHGKAKDPTDWIRISLTSCSAELGVRILREACDSCGDSVECKVNVLGASIEQLEPALLFIYNRNFSVSLTSTPGSVAV